ncbi:MAG: apolipoprotein N-acyltransferase, partial [Burkholderiales bacterium]|nr:apolipoprotein N-acyltransferase [Burkholderiales bacterium]
RKHHLVPFGEFVPPLFGWVLNVLHIPMSDFSRGARVQEPLKAAGERLAIGICYEDVFGEEVIGQLPEATLLVNMSNDAWFGERIAPWQHTQIAQTRALETGRYMLRATNTGVTSIIDHRGQLVASLPQLKTDALHGTAQGRTGATPYALAGNVPIVSLCLMLLAGLQWRRRQHKIAVTKESA